MLFLPRAINESMNQSIKQANKQTHFISYDPPFSRGNKKDFDIDAAWTFSATAHAKGLVMVLGQQLKQWQRVLLFKVNLTQIFRQLLIFGVLRSTKIIDLI